LTEEEEAINTRNEVNSQTPFTSGTSKPNELASSLRGPASRKLRVARKNKVWGHEGVTTRTMLGELGANQQEHMDISKETLQGVQEIAEMMRRGEQMPLPATEEIVTRCRELFSNYDAQTMVIKQNEATHKEDQEAIKKLDELLKRATTENETLKAAAKKVESTHVPFADLTRLSAQLASNPILIDGDGERKWSVEDINRFLSVCQELSSKDDERTEVITQNEATHTVHQELIKKLQEISSKKDVVIQRKDELLKQATTENETLRAAAKKASDITSKTLCVSSLFEDASEDRAIIEKLARDFCTNNNPLLVPATDHLDAHQLRAVLLAEQLKSYTLEQKLEKERRQNSSLQSSLTEIHAALEK